MSEYLYYNTVFPSVYFFFNDIKVSTDLLCAGSDGEAKLQILQCRLDSEIVARTHHTLPHLTLAFHHTIATR